MNNFKLNTLILLSLAFIATSCGGGSTESTETETVAEAPAAPMTLEEAEKGWETNYGVGPIKSLELPAEIDQTMADAGKVVFEAKCTACHKIEKNFIGPSPKGILERRTAAWVMNMILKPEVMIAEDPIARQLLMKFNGAPMANQNLSEEEARSVLEYFRTL